MASTKRNPCTSNHKRASLAAALLFLIAACAGQPGSSEITESPSDPALRLAQKVMDALGGKEAWDNTRHIRFTFFGRRTHHWDKRTGNHRLEGDSEDGQRYVVLQNIQTRAGDVYVDGVKLDGTDAEEWRDRAYRSWINDTYWLLMPYKLRDPGVLLSYEGTETVDGQPYEVLHLRFESVGLTPGDQYWAYVHPQSGLMERWAYRLERMEPDAPPTAWQWTGWTQFGNIKLAPHRIRVEDGFQAELGNIAVFSELPATVYTSPDPVPATE